MSKERVTGIGGIFFRSADKAATAEWYRTHLGVPVEDWGGYAFQWRQQDDPEKTGSTVWSPFADDTDYFGSGDQEFMLNFRVDDLDAVLTQLAEEGVEVVNERHEDDFGKFGWVIDGDGRRVELWEPPESK